MDLQAGPDGTNVVVTAVEGDQAPDGDYWRPYASQLSPDGARELAGKLRRFAAAGRGLGAAGDAAPTAGLSPATAVPAAQGQPRRVSNTRGKNFEYDPGTGATAVIEPDGWRAVVSPSSPTGVAARLLYWNAEIKDGRGDDATETAARELLDPLSAAELRELAEDVGAVSRGARTKPQMVDSIVNTAISSARKNRALRQG
jgi:hypothetical protein